ncbi:MAG: type phosphodiesterase/nucleotide pyrophosphatase [Candidatus Solibacter sp.]|nr:type phosphodiesterase/nucleotide pyrophosphatase [Candidatus Solibacter sp.]
MVHITPELAYIGPGAGFAFLGSFLTLLGGLLLGLISVLLWPFRIAMRAIRGQKGYKQAKVQKLIFLGLDGLDPGLAERYMSEGKLPNMSKLREQGGFHRLRTTFPALSPVAWSTFATGVNPARHSMFDFLNRNLRSYMPELSSTRVRDPERVLKLGKYRIPLSRPIVEMRRKSRTFWQILGEHQIASTILRVPITFPPEKFNGRMLSAMCTPDLLGTQGTFALFTTRNSSGEMESGNRYPLALREGLHHGEIEGPANNMEEGAGAMKIPFTLKSKGKGRATLHISDQKVDLVEGDYTEWITLTFKASLGITVSGIARFLLTETEPEVSLYHTPININPDDPALPISHPTYYATYLAKLLGVYSTLGMAEDTWALNEHAIDSDAFLKQAYLTYDEREAMFFSALDRTRRGVVACVFDTTDRVQHMFFAQKDRGGPYSKVIEDLYIKADRLVGKAFNYVDEETALFVISDHGFASFERGADLNSWFLKNGYLTLKPGTTGESSYLKDIDWEHTRAYTFGLAGVYINQQGREAQGIVKPGAEASALKKELAAKLSGLRDEERDRLAIRTAWPSESLYTGPYLDAAPDLIIGFADGYRASWDAAVGKTTGKVFTDNLKAWSGDHCIDPHLVPGVIFCNRKIFAEDPGIEDMAPTALKLFGIQPPPYMEGKSVLEPGTQTVEREVAA